MEGRERGRSSFRIGRRVVRVWERNKGRGRAGEDILSGMGLALNYPAGVFGGDLLMDIGDIWSAEDRGFQLLRRFLSFDALSHLSHVISFHSPLTEGLEASSSSHDD